MKNKIGLDYRQIKTVMDYHKSLFIYNINFVGEEIFKENGNLTAKKYYDHFENMHRENDIVILYRKICVFNQILKGVCHAFRNKEKTRRHNRRG